MQESLQTHLVRRELRDLRADMHVESNQPQMRQGSDNLRHRQRLVKRNPELHSLLTGARVGMRRLDEHLRIDPQRNSRLYTNSSGDGVEDVDFLLRFNVYEQDVGPKGLFHLDFSLTDSAEDNVVAGESCFQRAVELAARNDVHARAELAQQGKNRDARVRLHTVVEARIYTRQRRLKLTILIPDRAHAVHVGRSAYLSGDCLKRHSLHAQTLAAARADGRSRFVALLCRQFGPRNASLA